MSASFDFEGELEVAAGGQMLIVHGIEEPSVHWLTLTLTSSEAVQSTLLAPDGPACNVGVDGGVTLVRSGPDEPFEVMDELSGFRAACAR